MKRVLVTVLAIGLSLTAAWAQRAFRLQQGIDFIHNGQVLPDPQNGGLNAPLPQMMDLNNDGLQDLVILDRYSAFVSCFVAQGQPGAINYVRAQAYEPFFPKLEYWFRLVDMDCDGDKDIVACEGSSRVKVYTNTGTGGAYAFTLTTPVLTYLTLAGFTDELFISASDIPEIVDYDGDGDLDIISILPGGSTIALYKNYVREQQNTCAGFALRRETNCFGNVTFSTNCTAFSYNLCRTGPDPRPNERLLHNGASVTYEDVNGDGQRDLLLGDIGCTHFSTLLNQGTNTIPRFNRDSTFLQGLPDNISITLPIYPAAYRLDIDQDGAQDIVVCISDYLFDNFIEFRHRPMQWYRNVAGASARPRYVLQNESFITDRGVDWGSKVGTAFVDLDADGDKDLLVGTEGYSWAVGRLVESRLIRYNNIGTVGQPRYELADTNYLGLRSYSLWGIVPYVTDLNNDGLPDLVIRRKEFGFNMRSFWLAGQAGGGFDATQRPFDISFPWGTEYYAITDVDQDGLKDVLFLKEIGTIIYHRNTGTAANPQFTETDTDYGGFSMAHRDMRGTFFLALADFNNDGREDMLRTDRTGVAKLYSDFRSNTATLYQRADSILFKMEGTAGLLTYSRFDESTIPTAEDLNADGFTDLMFGTLNGGLQVYYSESPNGLAARQALLSLKLAPNPLEMGQSLQVELPASGELSLMDLQGRVLRQRTVEDAGFFRWDLNHLPAGVYQLRWSGASGQAQSRVIIY